jgi:peroxiredoxin
VLSQGDKAASFSLLDANGQKVKSTDIQPGFYQVLIFYRGSWCATCQNWLLDIKKDQPRFIEAHAAVAAVSADSVADSAAFNNQWRFNFPLLSDTDLKLIDAYGLRDPKHGHHGEDISHVGVVIVDPKGVVRYRYAGNEAFDHPKNDEILFILKQIQSGARVPNPGGVQ